MTPHPRWLRIFLRLLVLAFRLTEERHVCRCELCAETREQFERKRRNIHRTGG